MRSPTQRALTDTELHEVTNQVLEAGLAAAEPLHGGTYSTAYRLVLDDGRRVVLKVGPPAGVETLTYERDLAATEAEVFTKASALPGVPAPQVLGADLDGAVVGREVIALEHLDGTLLSDAGPSLTDDVQVRVRCELGAICARLHQVTGERFGYTRAEPRHDGDRWRVAFLSMVEDLVADAHRIPTTRPPRTDEVAAAIQRHAEDLDAVEVPTLVHFDLWDGNVLVDADAGVITGIIDGERAFYGDPLAEFASVAIWRGPDVVPLVLEGYQAELGPLRLGSAEQRRLAFYRLYLHQIMLIEPVTRGYPLDAPPAHVAAIHQRVDDDLRLLARPR